MDTYKLHVVIAAKYFATYFSLPTKLTVDSVTAGMNSAYKQVTFENILFWISLAAVVAFLTAICPSAASMISEALAAFVSDHIHDLLHAK